MARFLSTKRSKPVAEKSAPLAELGEFQKEFKRLRALAKNEDLDSDAVSLALTRSLLAMVIEMIPTLENTVKTTGGKGVYPVGILVGLARELANDLRAMKDSSTTCDKIMQECVEPNLKVLAQATSNEITSIKRLLYEYTQVKQQKKLIPFVEKSLSDLLSRIEIVRSSFSGQISKLLNT